MNTIVHPCAVINAEAGPIIIGDYCLIEEQAKITHRFIKQYYFITSIQKTSYFRLPFDKANNTEEKPVLTIGSHNVFEVDCEIEASSIGDSNVFESKCYVGPNVSVPNDCIIGAGCHLINATLKDKAIIFGKDCQYREGLDRPDVCKIYIAILLLIF